MIKGRSPFPFDTIGLAVSFSPNLPELIRETRRLSDLHGSTAVFIHVGKKTSEKQRELIHLLSANGFNDSNSRIYWEPGDTVSSILRVCKHEVVDLLLIGASDRSEFKLPVGQIAVAVATKAKCSVLVYTGKPNARYNNIIVNGFEHRKTDLTVLTSIYFAEKESADTIHITDDNGTDFAGVSESYTPNSTESASASIRHAATRSKIRLNYVSLDKDHSTSISEYSFKNKSDLIVTYSSDHHLLIFDRIASGNAIESLLKDLPCSMLIVHSRLTD